MNYDQAIDELRRVVAEAESVGLYLEGNLLKGKRHKYTRKDGTVSEYPTSPVLQYNAGAGRRKSKRIPPAKVEIVERLLENGIRRKKLMARHRELTAIIALNFKKNSGNSVSPPEDRVRRRRAL